MVCNPAAHVLKVIEVFKRFGRDCKPRPASAFSFAPYNSEKQAPAS